MTHAVDRTQVGAAVQAALDALAECGRLSTGCASSMIELGDMVVEVRHALDCADLCAAAERLLARHGGLDDDGAVAAVVEAAIAGCTASAAACGAHADHHAHCAAHSRSAARCRDADRVAPGLTTRPRHPGGDAIVTPGCATVERSGLDPLFGADPALRPLRSRLAGTGPTPRA